MSKTSKSGKATKQAVNAVKRAAIYVRVSSEKQADADKESPIAQERDCRALAERQGYQVVAVYRDTEKYRVGKKLVEPSGTRADRPGLRQMLADARRGDFEVILAWREDRLYRSYRPMLDVLDCIDETGVDVELAKETFDKNIAPVKAWAARMELDAKRDRQAMGVTGRLKQGKAWPLVVSYGYQVENDIYTVNESEAQWVRLIWRWFGEDVFIPEIRRRLIAGGAKQRGNPIKYPWSEAMIRRIASYDYYFTGVFKFTWDGETYDLPVPVIVDAESASKVKARLARYKAYPAGNLKADALAAGLIYCKKCGTKMSVRGMGKRDNKYAYYRCRSFERTNLNPGCAKNVRIYRIDDEVWDKLWELISVPGKLEVAIEKRVAELQAQEFDAEGECAKLQKQLDDLAMKRQEAIALFQEKVITKDDLELRLTSLTFEQVEAERELRDKSLLVGNRAECLLAVARIYRENVLSGAIDVTKEPETPEEAARVWQFKKTMVQGLVTRVGVKADKSTEVTFELDFSDAALAENLCINDQPVHWRVTDT